METDQADRVNAFVGALSVHLPGWTFQPARSDDNWRKASLTHDCAEGREIYFMQAWHERGRVSVRGSYPQGLVSVQELLPHGQQAPKITVGLSREPGAAAKDILRRLIPPYFDLWSKLQAKEAERREAREDRLKRRSEIFEALGLPVSPQSANGTRDWQVDICAPGVITGKVGILQDSEISMYILHAPHEAGLALCRQIRELMEKGAKNVHSV